MLNIENSSIEEYPTGIFKPSKDYIKRILEAKKIRGIHFYNPNYQAIEKKVHTYIFPRVGDTIKSEKSDKPIAFSLDHAQIDSETKDLLTSKRESNFKFKDFNSTIRNIDFKHYSNRKELINVSHTDYHTLAPFSSEGKNKLNDGRFVTCKFKLERRKDKKPLISYPGIGRYSPNYEYTRGNAFKSCKILFTIAVNYNTKVTIGNNLTELLKKFRVSSKLSHIDKDRMYKSFIYDISKKS